LIKYKIDALKKNNSSKVKIIQFKINWKLKYFYYRIGDMMNTSVLQKFSFLTNFTKKLKYKTHS